MGKAGEAHQTRAAVTALARLLLLFHGLTSAATTVAAVAAEA